MDQAIIMSKEIGDTSDVFKLAMKASHYYQQHGSSGSASLLLNKVADMLQQSDPESAVKLLKEASNISGVCWKKSSLLSTSQHLMKVFRM